MSTINNTLRGERGLMRPQVLVILALFAIAAFAFQLRDSALTEAATSAFVPATVAQAGTCSDDANALIANESPTVLRATCTNGQTLILSDFGLEGLIPATASDFGFTVRVQAKTSDDDGTNDFVVELSWNDGTNFTSSGNTTGSVELEPTESGSTDSVVTAGGCNAEGQFDRTTWAFSELDDIRVRLTASPDDSDESLFVDYVEIQACYRTFEVLDAGTDFSATSGADGGDTDTLTVLTGATVFADVTAAMTDGVDTAWAWGSTQFTLTGVGPDVVMPCNNHTDQASPNAGALVQDLSFTAPATPGVYNIVVTAFTSGTICATTPTAVLTEVGALTVNAPNPLPTPPPLTITPTGSITDTDPDFTWTASADTENFRYDIQVSQDCTGGTIFDGVLTPTFSTSTLADPPETLDWPNAPLALGNWCWRVRATDSAGSTAYSAQRDFTIANPLPSPAPTPISPNGTISDTDPTFTWTASTDADPFHYDLQITQDCTSDPFSSGVTDFTTGGSVADPPETMDWPNAPLAPGAWCWRVRAQDATGQTDYSTQMNFTIAQPAAATNPALSDSCGLDLVLVIDSSGSIDDQMGAIQTAYVAFVNALLPGTPTEIAVVDFDDTASTAQGFTDDIGDLEDAIEGTVAGGRTNWQDALEEARGLLPNRPEKQDVVVFMSDGNPNNTQDDPFAVSEAIAMVDAVVEANLIKAAPARIITIGLAGDSGLNNANLIAISSAGANFTVANVGELEDALEDIASDLCGGTITVEKRIDSDGVAGDPTSSGGAGWGFSIQNLSTGDTVTASPLSTAASGFTAPFEINIDAGGVGSTPDSATLNVVETTLLSGHAFMSISCTKQDGPDGGTAPDPVTVTPVANGGTLSIGRSDIVNCVVLNTPVPSLTLMKNLVKDNGGTANATDWTLTANDGGAGADLSGASGVSGSIAAGTAYTLAESGGPAGYSASLWNCDVTGGSDVNNTATITLQNGQSAVCTITNNDQPSRIRLRKYVTNNHGGTTGAGQWVLTATGSVTSFTTAGQTDEQNDNPDLVAHYTGPLSLNTGVYVLSESSIAGYIAGNWECMDSFTFVQVPVVLNGQQQPTVTLPLGRDFTCSINNDDEPASITIRKVVSGITGVDAQLWTLSVDGPNGFSWDSDPNNDATVAEADAEYSVGGGPISAGVYTLSESGPSGYDASAWGCTGGSLVGDQLTLANGDNAICEITNRAQPGTLHIVKVVTNNSGGTLLCDAFGFSLNAGLISTNFPIDDCEVTVVAPAGFAISGITETPVAGYAITYDGCGDFVFQPGDNRTCTITNNDIPGTLNVNKVLINDDNGPLTDEDDFSFTINGGAPIPFESDGTNSYTVAAGTYDIIETANQGYDVQHSGCANVVIPLAGSATCTITNNDQPARLTVNKVVVNGAYGTATATSFSFQVNGGSATAFEADGSNLVLLDAGTYSVTEPAVAGYTTTYNNCTNLAIANGGSATCTITNTYRIATFSVFKDYSDDNIDQVTITIDCTSGTEVTIDGNANDGPAFDSANFDVHGYALGATCTATESSVLPGYIQGVSCVGNVGSFCTITNTLNRATFTVNKDFIPNNVAPVLITLNCGSGAIVDNTLDAAEGAPAVFTVNGITGTSTSCTATESVPVGYSANQAGCAVVSLAANGSNSCTIVNTRLPDVSLEKTGNGPVDMGDAASYTLTVTNPGPGTALGVVITDTLPGTGWIDNSDSCTIAPAVNDALTCNVGTMGPETTFTVVVARPTTIADCGGLENTGTVTLENEFPNSTANNSDSASIEVLCPISINVDKSSPNVTFLDDPAIVLFRVVVTNTSDIPVQLESLIDDVYGDITFVHGDIVSTNCNDGGMIAAHASYQCEFEAWVEPVGDTHVNVLTVVVSDPGREDEEASDSDDDVIKFSNPPITTPVPTTPALVTQVASVQSTPAPVSQILPTRLPSTGAGPIADGFAWLMVVGLAAIGLGSTVILVTRFRREDR